jgi:uncharacterized protein Yka (UPF0111/DUF47 family)
LFSLMPRNTAFFDLLEKGAEVIIRAAETYAQLGHDYERREQHVARIRQCEHDGDEVAHRTFDRLDQSFITPFEREDIETLMIRMDDVVDEIDAAAKRLTLYQIPALTPWFIKQTDLLLSAAKLVGEAVAHLRDLKKKPEVLNATLKEIHFLENVGDDNNHAALAELFATATDPLLVMKWKEIYDLTERAVDRCEDIANIIRGIVLRNA